MEKFEIKKMIDKTIFKTNYGVVSVSNINFDVNDIQKILPEIVFEDDNLKFMFQENELNERTRYLILQRFLPNDDVKDVKKYIIDSISHNKTFYSFLAEGMLGLVYRDIFGYKTSTCIIDMEETLSDTHSGVDVCLFDEDEQIIILGEAKFYDNFKDGMNKIIQDFIENRIYNKLDSLKRKIEKNDLSYEIIIKKLDKNKYSRISLKEFMQQKIQFAGFVLHGCHESIGKYLLKNTYESFNINVDLLKTNIERSIGSKVYDADYSIILFHLPISNKKELIEEIIKKANVELKKL